MYKTILVTLDQSRADRVILDHIRLLATEMHSRLVLLHVVSGAAARFHGSEASGREVQESKAYLEQVRAELTAAGIPTEAELAYGEPSKEIVKWVERKGCDLVAMGTHGHQFVADLVLGDTAVHVQHNISVPVLLLRGR